MKTILINRHAKSDWNDGSIKDFDRPLNKRGTNDAPIMANRLKNQNIFIDKIISSPANRAITTAKVFAEKLNINEIQEEIKIYHYGEKFIKENLPKMGNAINTILFFGHNPDFTSLATYYTGELFSNIPTCGIVCIDFEINDWSEIDNQNGKIRFFDYPKSIND